MPLAEYVPKASELIRERASKKAEAAVAAGVAALEAAAAEDGATRTASGLVVLPLTEGDGASPSAVDTVEVHYEGTVRVSSDRTCTCTRDGMHDCLPCTLPSRFDTYGGFERSIASWLTEPSSTRRTNAARPSPSR